MGIEPQIAVLGPGGVGGFVAAALTHAGADVTVVATEASCQKIASDGVQIKSAVIGDFTAFPKAVSDLQVAVDYLLIATKATALQQALERVSVAPKTVVPLLNGLDHMATLRKLFSPQTVAAGTIRIESTKIAAGSIEQTSSTTRIELASDQQTTREQLTVLAKLLSDSGIKTVVSDSEVDTLWSKLVRLNTLSLMTSSTGLSIGDIRSDSKLYQQLSSVLEETAKVAVKEGAKVDVAAALNELETADPLLRSSMYRDLQAGRATELDAIAGSVMRAAERNGLSCPTMRTLYADIAAKSAKMDGCL